MAFFGSGTSLSMSSIYVFMGPEFTAWNQKRQGGCFYIRGEYSYLTNLVGGTPESIAIRRVRSLALGLAFRAILPDLPDVLTIL